MKKRFANYAPYRRAIALLKQALGLTLTTGDLAALPAGGHSLFFRSSSSGPFVGSASGTGIHVEAGFLAFAGRMIWFPADDYSGTTPGGVFLKVTADFNATANAPGDAWDIEIDDTTAPVLEWHVLNTTGTHALIEDTDPSGSETISVTSGVVYFPIAFQHGSSVVSIYSGHLCLLYKASGTAVLTESFGSV